MILPRWPLIWRGALAALCALAIMIATALLLVAASGCSTWRSTAASAVLAGAQAVRSTHQAGRAALHQQCMTAARACPAKPAPCPALERCQAKRRDFDRGVLAAKATVDGARLALTTAIAVDGAQGARDKALAAIAALPEALARLAKLARELGILP